MPPRILTLPALAVLAACAAASAGAQNFASLSAQARSPGGLTYAEARIQMRQLKEVTFEKADANGDGVIDGREWPTLQGVYNALYRDR